MKIKTVLILITAVSLTFISANLIFSQEPNIEGEGGALGAAKNETDMQWVWGEVVSQDKENKTILLKYLDYETDQEKEISIKTDEQTAYENIQPQDGINPKDTLSIDYIISNEGENIAKNISVEKPEGPQSAETGSAAEGQKALPAAEKDLGASGY